jgi:hypothetical protein
MTCGSDGVLDPRVGGWRRSRARDERCLAWCGGHYLVDGEGD